MLRACVYLSLRKGNRNLSRNSIVFTRLTSKSSYTSFADMCTSTNTQKRMHLRYLVAPRLLSPSNVILGRDQLCERELRAPSELGGNGRHARTGSAVEQYGLERELGARLDLINDRSACVAQKQSNVTGHGTQRMDIKIWLICFLHHSRRAESKRAGGKTFMENMVKQVQPKDGEHGNASTAVVQ